MLSGEGWREIGIVVMACRAVERGIVLEGLVIHLFAVEVGRNWSGRCRGRRHSWETAAGLPLLLKSLRMYVLLRTSSGKGDKSYREVW